MNVLSEHRRSFLRTLPGLPGKFWEEYGSVALIVVWAAVTALVLVFSGGLVMAAGALTVVVFVLVISLYRLDWGFYLFIGAVLVLDQHIIPTFDPITLKVDYFSNLNAVSYLPSLSFAYFNALEVHLILLFLIWLAHAAIKRRFTLNGVFVWLPMLLFYGAMVFSILYGRARGGDMVISFWETRGLFYLGIMYLFVPQVIQTEEQVDQLFRVCIWAITVKAFQGFFRFAQRGFTFGGLDTFTNHEDPVFIVTLFILLIGLTILGGNPRQKRLLRWLLLPLCIGFYVGNRRAAFVSLLVSVIAVLCLLDANRRRSVMRGFLVFAGVFSIYLAIFWNSGGTMGMMAQKVKSTVLDTPEAGERDYSSTLYRKYENYNLAVTYSHAPIVGIGFGRKFEMPISVFGFEKMERSIFAYIPHNQIIWLAANMGAVGFFAFLFFLNSFLLRGAKSFAMLRNPYLKALSLMALIAILNQLVVSYVDMQLTYYRNMVFLGCLMGLLPVFERLDQQSPPVTEADDVRPQWSSEPVALEEVLGGIEQ